MENIVGVLAIVWFALFGLAALRWPETLLRWNVGLVRWFERRRLYPRWAAAVQYWISEPPRGTVILRILGAVFLLATVLIAKDAFSR